MPNVLAGPADSRSADAAATRAHEGLTRLRWWRELVFLGLVYLLYSVIRNAAPAQVGRAQNNATAILDLEGVLGLDVEQGLNLRFGRVEWLAVPANYYYATMHFAVTLTLLVWLYRRRPQAYRAARGVLLVMTLIALVGYWLYPLAPPRLMAGGGFVDTVRAWGTWGVAASEPVTSASNQYAAMPSMHVGWSLWCGVIIARHVRRPAVQALGMLYPAVTLLVVVVTGNHFVLDAAGAFVAFIVAVVAVRVGGGNGPLPQAIGRAVPPR
ncbi:MAG TPA: phosphatase PAP2 family protein [Cellulomonas sp.]|uniref:phosphatase PAP2 family protein n=1 Tax=Cellulomonas sp. TaxID=40001 RepID=UPI002E30F1DA|nr:phosphatase PAP2 family protein [Cellulomonas sp.]HEX5333529.1 phosphatase PAP2 family protein [Cellulomonas sp.]